MVDIDEADVAVLNQNLTKTKELFNSISKSLNTISNKSTNALTKIKPVLKDVNQLTNKKVNIEQGLAKLREVSGYAERTKHFETILSNPIDIIGIKKYLDTLAKLKGLLSEMKQNIKRFIGILINFENMIDKLELNLVTYFKIQINNNNFQEILIILNYFGSGNKQINKIFIDSRSRRLVEKMNVVEKSVNFKPKNVGHNLPPYERGSIGIAVYCKELIDYLSKEVEILNKLNNVEQFGKIVDHAMTDFDQVLEKNYLSYFHDDNLIFHDLLILDIIESLDNFTNKFQKFDDLKSYKVNLTITKLLGVFKNLFKENFKYIEARIMSVETLTETNSTEIVVELITKIRKQTEYLEGLKKIIDSYNKGEWLNIKTLRFINVGNSVIKGEGDNNHLGNYMCDIIDCIMINLEIDLKDIKKSTQGYYLIRNLLMIENIKDRSANFFEILGSVGQERLNKLKNRFLKLFLDDWNYASYIIIKEMTEINAISAASNSKEMLNKEKEQIKELFKTFNESFEEAVRNYKKFHINDPNLKNYLINEIKKLILNAYFKLYDKYGNSGFTKNKAKYVKFNKIEFENYLNQQLA